VVQWPCLRGTIWRKHLIAMTFAQAIFHLLNFILPALGMAVFMPLAGRWVMGAGGQPWPRRALGHLLSGVLVLALGLVLQGQDGQMSTYAVLVLVAGTLEWALHRGWSRA
jgi:hypothetical protein